MLNKFSKEIENELFKFCLESLENGKQARKTVVLYSSIIVFMTLLIILVNLGLSTAFYISLTISVSALCLIWAIMSMSASINGQLDLITKLYVHYSEDKNKEPNSK